MGKECCEHDCNQSFGSAGFALLVVLFILLIIIGTAYSGNNQGYNGGYYC
ncbi:YjcZ family sporulation protein [Oceanobacillus timonensis]